MAVRTANIVAARGMHGAIFQKLFDCELIHVSCR
jgi:hypothetical protein